jgi:hypothetical protein
MDFGEKLFESGVADLGEVHHMADLRPAEEQAKIMGAVHARIPMVIPDGSDSIIG